MKSNRVEMITGISLITFGVIVLLFLLEKPIPALAQRLSVGGAISVVAFWLFLRRFRKKV